MVALFRIVVAMAAWLILAGGIPAAQAMVPKVCDNHPDIDKRIASCTAFLAGKTGKRDRIPAHVWRGRSWLHKFRYEEAIADLTEALALVRETRRYREQRHIIYNSRGVAFAGKGDDDSALQDYDAALQLKPGYHEALTNRGNAYQHQRKFALALQDYDAALKSDPRNAVIYNNRSYIHAEKGDLDRAIADVTHAIRLDPKGGLAYSSRAGYFQRRGDLDAALSDADQAIRLQRVGLNDSPEGSFGRRAEIRRAKGDFLLALADCEQIRTIDPDYVPGLTCFGNTYEKLREFDKAREWYRRAIAAGNNPANSRRFEHSSKASREDAEARLAALDSSAPPPAPVPVVAIPADAKSIPTPAASADIVTKPVAVERREAAAQGRRVALIIGNSAYRNVSELPNPKNDATVMATALRNMGFASVTLVLDATREIMVDHLRRFAEEVENADWATVYYAGHGIEVQGQNYLIPIDATLAADRDAQFEAVQLDQVMGAMESARKLRLVILDACRDNPFAARMRRIAAPLVASVRGAVSVARGLGEVMVTGASLVVFSAKHGQIALDGDGTNSPFASALTQRLATPGVEINKIFRLVRDDVLEATAGRQEPYTYGSLPGREDFFFVAAN